MRKITLLIASILFSIGVFGQVSNVVPIDPKIKYGKLENGLTYYIRANKVPESRAEFYIAQNVGSILEEDSQAGLAHFLEHMAFNGTEHFPKKEMLNYLENNGVKFGVNINAYTSFDETVYNLSDIPTTNPKLMDSCLLILYDWSCGIALEGEEIDSERGVIREEWRTRGGANTRILEQLLPSMYKDSKYATRLPIGSIDVINNFKHNEIRDYYKKWYRPDLQAIIVVGDFDADKMETKVKELFSKIPKPVNPAKREYFGVPDNHDPEIGIATDTETTNIMIRILHKHDVLNDTIKNSVQGYVLQYVNGLISTMLNNRLSEITQTQQDAPFVLSAAGYGRYMVSKTKDAFTIVAISKEDKILESVKTMQIETERAKRFGFTEAEYDRAKTNSLKNIENLYNNREKSRNESHVREYVGHFTSGELIPGIEYEYDLIKKISETIPLEAVNGFFRNMLREDNTIVSIQGPKKDGLVYPTKEEIKSILANIKNEKIEAYKEEAVDVNLIPNLPKAGTIVKKEKNKTFKDVSVWTLSNGMKVVLKPTDFKADEILMTSTAEGGLYNFEEKDIVNTSLINYLYTIGGAGNFSSVNLRKALTGKTAKVSPEISDFSHGISGSSTIGDFETLMQLTYLTLMEPRKDENAYNAFLENVKTSLKNQQADPNTAFLDSIIMALYGNNNPYPKSLKYEQIENISYDRMLEIYKEVFSNNKNQVFVFVGNIDEAKIEPYVKTYLASLPAGKKMKKGDDKTKFDAKSLNNVFTKELQNPMASIFNAYVGKVEYNQKNRLAFTTLSQILDIVYTEKIREEEGGTYGVSVDGQIAREGNKAVLQILFDTDPERTSLNEKVISIFEDIAENGPRDADFAKVKGYMLKVYEEGRKENSQWKSMLTTYFYHNEDVITNNLREINNLTKDDVKNLAKKIKNEFKLKTVIMKP